MSPATNAVPAARTANHEWVCGGCRREGGGEFQQSHICQIILSPKVRIDHQTKSLRFGTDVTFSYKDESPEGPFVQVSTPH